MILAELHDVDVGGDALNVRSGSETMRKIAANVYATNLSHDVVGDRCAERLKEFLNDECESVRREVCKGFFNMPGEPLIELKDYIEIFIESPSIEDNAESLMHSLRESNVELPQVVCKTATRIIEFLGDEGRDFAHRGVMVAGDMATLVVRLYEQTNDESMKTNCLDLIDRPEQLRYYGISDALAIIER